MRKDNLKLNFIQDKITDFLVNQNGFNITYLIFWLCLYTASIIEGSFFDISLKKEPGIHYVPLIIDLGIIEGVILYLIIGWLVQDLLRIIPEKINKFYSSEIFKKTSSNNVNNILIKFEHRSNSSYAYLVGLVFSSIYLIHEYYYDKLYYNFLINIIIFSTHKSFPFTRISYFIVNTWFAFLAGIVCFKLYYISKITLFMFNSSAGSKLMHPFNINNLNILGDIFYDISKVFIISSLVPFFSYILSKYCYAEASLIFISRFFFQSFILLIISIMSFILPIYYMHRFMLKLKVEYKNDINDKYNKLLYNTLNNPIEKESIYEILLYSNIKKEVNKVNVWPIPITIYGSLFLSHLIYPIIFLLREKLIEAILNIFYVII